jgi:hypothetical protein
MFRTSSCPSSGATTTAVAASGLPSESGAIAVLLVVVGPTGPTTTNNTAIPPLSDGCVEGRRGCHLHNTQQTQERNNIHAVGGIRTGDPRNRAAVDLRLRPHGYRDRRRPYYSAQQRNQCTRLYVRTGCCSETRRLTPRSK